MARRVYLHIGAPKTGTSYLQALLAKNRDALAERGIRYPDSKSDAHHKAVWDLRGTPQQRSDTKGIPGSWQGLVDQVNAADSDALVSSEHFVFAKQPQIRTALSAFDAETHVIYTARDLARQVPAVWQERVKNNQSMSYREFVAAVMDRTGPGSRSFWGAQDASGVLDRWGGGMDPPRLHLVTTPPAGQPPTVLWDRFVSVVGVTGSDLDTDTGGAANESLSMAQTELLRRYNERYGDGVSWQHYRRLVRAQVDVFRESGSGRRIALTPAEHAYFTERAAEITHRIASGGYHIVGDVADLVPAPLQPQRQQPAVGRAGEDPGELSDAELLDAALDVIQGLLVRQADERQAARERTRQPNRQRRGDDAGAVSG